MKRRIFEFRHIDAFPTLCTGPAMQIQCFVRLGSEDDVSYTILSPYVPFFPAEVRLLCNKSRDFTTLLGSSEWKSWSAGCCGFLGQILCSVWVKIITNTGHATADGLRQFQSAAAPRPFARFFFFFYLVLCDHVPFAPDTKH